MKVMRSSAANITSKESEASAKTLVLRFQERLGDPKEKKQARVDQKLFINRLLGPKAYSEAVKIRGHAYIRGVEMIVRNHEAKPNKAALAMNASLQRLLVIKRNWEELLYYDKHGLKILVQVLSEELQDKIFNHTKKHKTIISKELRSAENHDNNWAKETVETVLLLDKKNNLFQVRIDAPITDFTQAQETQWLEILSSERSQRPRWFNKLSLWEQHFLRKRVSVWKKACLMAGEEQRPNPNLGKFLAIPATTLRGYPGVRNCYCSHYYTFRSTRSTTKSTRSASRGANLKLTNKLFRIRSGHLFSDKIKNRQERLSLLKDNIKQLILAAVVSEIKQPLQEENEEILIDLQVLPPPSLDHRKDRDLLLAIDELRSELTGEGLRDFLAHNNISISLDCHPKLCLISSSQRIHKYAIFSQWISNLVSLFSGNQRNKENRRVIQTLRQRIKQGHQKNSLQTNNNIPMAAKAQVQMDELTGFFQRLGDLFVTGINHNAERAALEQIAIAGIGGIRIGCCTFGRDKEGTLSEHVGAKIAFFGKYGFFPPIPRFFHRLTPQQKKWRNEYETMVAKEFLAGHDQTISAAHARGASGLKSAEVILGKTIIKKIKHLLVNNYFKDEPHKKRKHWERLDTSGLSHKIGELSKPKRQKEMWGLKKTLYEQLKPEVEPKKTLSSMLKTDSMLQRKGKKPVITYKSEIYHIAKEQKEL